MGISVQIAVQIVHPPPPQLWHEQQAGVYHCQWGTDVVRVIVAGELPREAHNAPLHLFSASPELVGFGRGAYRQRSDQTSRLLRGLFERLQTEGFAMSYTMEDFNREYIKKLSAKLTPEERREFCIRPTSGSDRQTVPAKQESR